MWFRYSHKKRTNSRCRNSLVKMAKQQQLTTNITQVMGLTRLQQCFMVADQRRNSCEIAIYDGPDSFISQRLRELKPILTSNGCSVEVVHPNCCTYGYRDIYNRTPCSGRVQSCCQDPELERLYEELIVPLDGYFQFCMNCTGNPVTPDNCESCIADHREGLKRIIRDAYPLYKRCYDDWQFARQSCIRKNNSRDAGEWSQSGNPDSRPVFPSSVPGFSVG